MLAGFAIYKRPSQYLQSAFQGTFGGSPEGSAAVCDPNLRVHLLGIEKRNGVVGTCVSQAHWPSQANQNVLREGPHFLGVSGPLFFVVLRALNPLRSAAGSIHRPAPVQNFSLPKKMGATEERSRWQIWFSWFS